MTSKKSKKNRKGTRASSNAMTEMLVEQIPQAESAQSVQNVQFSQKELRELSFEMSARWFKTELSPRLTLSVVNPWRIHAYWFITAEMMHQALKKTKAPHSMVIRVTDLTPSKTGATEESESFDVEVDGLENNWYIDLWQPGRHYVAELGLRGADNKLHLFERSNKIMVPRADNSPVLKFKLAEHKHTKSISKKAKSAKKPTHSVAHLTELLPPFRDFPNVQADTNNSKNESKNAELTFPALTSIQPEQAGSQHNSIINKATSLDTVSSAAFDKQQSPEIKKSERPVYGTEFPLVTAAEIVVTQDKKTPVNYDSIPELPPIDPLTVSPASSIFNPEALIESPDLLVEKARLAKYQTEQNLLDLTLTAQTMENNRNTDESGQQQHPLPPAVAPKPVIALEDVLADSYFSGSNNHRKLEIALQLELSGTSNADQVLTLFGQPVETDQHGRFSVQLKLDKSPGLAALVRAQRRHF